MTREARTELDDLAMQLNARYREPVVRKEYGKDIITVSDGGYFNLSITYGDRLKYEVSGDIFPEQSVEDVVDNPMMDTFELYYFLDRYFDPRMRE